MTIHGVGRERGVVNANDYEFAFVEIEMKPGSAAA